MSDTLIFQPRTNAGVHRLSRFLPRCAVAFNPALVLEPVVYSHAWHLSSGRQRMCTDATARDIVIFRSPSLNQSYISKMHRSKTEPVLSFRRYQDTLFRSMVRALNNTKHPFLIAPPGAGKTILLRTLAEHVLRYKIYRKVVISTPQNQIKHGFRRSCRVRACGSTYDLSVPLHQQAQDLVAWLGNPGNTGVVLYCNASLTNPRGHAAANPFQHLQDCSDILWVVDEAHHIEAPGLGKVLAWFREHGGRVCYATATPFNNNSLLSVLDDDSVDASAFHPLGEHIHLGYAPEIKFEHVQIDGSQSKLDWLDYTTDVARPWAWEIARKYVADGRPKTLVVIPPTFSGVEGKTTQDTARALITELEKKLPGIKCLNTVGQDNSIEQRIHAEIEAVINGLGVHDIIVSCRRFEEGTDVPDIAAVYIIGMRNDRQTVQLTGRALRDKRCIPGFASKHPNYVEKAKVVFFTPKANSRDLALSALKVIAATQNFKSYAVVVGPSRVKEAVNTLGSSEAHKAAADVMASFMLRTSMASLINDNAFLELVAGSYSGRTSKQMHSACSAEARGLIEALALGKLNKHQVTLFARTLVAAARKHTKVDDSDPQVYRSRITSDPDVRKIIESAVTAYVDQHVDVVLDESAQAYITVLGGDTVKTWGRLLDEDLSTAQQRYVRDVHEICDFKEAHGRYPAVNSTTKASDGLLSAKYARLRQAYRKTEYMRQSMVAAADARGCFDFFDRLNGDAYRARRMHELCDFVDKHGRLPLQVASNTHERKLRHSLSLIQRYVARYGHNHAKTRLTSDIAKTRGHLRIIAPQTKDENLAARKRDIVAICAFIDKHGRNPNRKVMDERALRSKLDCLISAKHGKGTSKFYTEFDEVAAACGHPDLFEHIDYAGIIVDLCRFVDEHVRDPSSESADSTEAKLGKWLSRLRTIYKRGNMSARFVRYFEIAALHGHPDMFKNKANRVSVQAQLRSVRRLCTFKDVHRRNPLISSSDYDERRAARVLHKIRSISANPKPGVPGFEIYSETVQLLSELGHSGILNRQDPTAYCFDTLNAACDFYIKNGREPAYCRFNAEETALRYALRKVRKYVHGIGAVPAYFTHDVRTRLLAAAELSVCKNILTKRL